MKKVSKGIKDNLDYTRAPYAFRWHEHPEYIAIEGDDPLVITRDVEFQGEVTGIAETSGLVYVQESEPNPVLEGDLWLVPSTELFQIRANGAWKKVVYRESLADENETLDINAGYF